MVQAGTVTGEGRGDTAKHCLSYFLYIAETVFCGDYLPCNMQQIFMVICSGNMSRMGMTNVSLLRMYNIIVYQQ